MLPGAMQQAGLSLQFFKPTIIPGVLYNPRGTLLDGDWLRLVESYSHTLDAFGWYKSASIVLGGGLPQIEWWIENALGMHVEVYGPSLTPIFQGFVNQYAGVVSGLSVNGGPLLDAVNRCTVTYNPQDPTADPPQSGPETETPIGDDVDSQAKYGIIEVIFSPGASTDDEAEYARDAILLDKAEPERTEDSAIGQGDTPRITLTVAGYTDWLDRYIYNDPATLTTTAGPKIQAAIAADPNRLFSRNFAYIADPGILVSAADRDNKTAMALIKAIVARGSGPPGYSRWLFGVRDGRVVHYSAIPTNPGYEHRVAAVSQRIDIYGGGRVVFPWDVEPGQWTFMPHYLPGRGAPATDLRTDPRFMFNESVTYTAPWSVRIVGKRVGRVDQILAEYGMGGMS